MFDDISSAIDFSQDLSQASTKGLSEAKGRTLEPALSQRHSHTVELIPGSYTSRGRLYSVLYEGQEIVTDSLDPEFDACRMLLKMGITGKLTTYRGDMPCMILNIEKAAQYRTATNNQGTPVFKKRAF